MVTPLLLCHPGVASWATSDRHRTGCLGLVGMSSSRKKVVHFIRHGESEYNAAMRETGIDPMVYDAPLTAKGKKQARKTAEMVNEFPPPQLLVVSPLTRAIHTALLAVPYAPLAGRQAQDCGWERTRCVVSPLVREAVSGADDIGTPPGELEKAFPGLNVGDLPDVWWYPGPGGEEDRENGDWKASRRRYAEQAFEEPEEMFAKRMAEWVAWLSEVEEEEVMVVAHYHVVFALTGRSLGNGEMRSFLFSWEGEGEEAEVVDVAQIVVGGEDGGKRYVVRVTGPYGREEMCSAWVLEWDRSRDGDGDGVRVRVRVMGEGRGGTAVEAVRRVVAEEGVEIEVGEDDVERVVGGLDERSEYSKSSSS